MGSGMLEIWLGDDFDVAVVWKDFEKIDKARRGTH